MSSAKTSNAPKELTFQEKRRLFEKEDVFRRYRYDLAKRRRTFPWKELLLALFLFTVGGVLLALGVAIQTGHVDSEHHWPEASSSQQSLSFLIIGSIMFLPGSYVIYIAVMSLLGYEGYSLDEVASE